MKLKLVEVNNQGDINLEHVVIKAYESAYLGSYILMKTNSNLDILSAVWLPDGVFVNQDHEVYIYTGSPTRIDKQGLHYVSLGKDQPLWGGFEK